jgi:y4mF family transcriptional regulator
MRRKPSPIAEFLKRMRKLTSLTQADMAARAGVGLRFVRDVEQGKQTVRLDKLDAVLALFGYRTGPVRIVENGDAGAQKR